MLTSTARYQNKGCNEIELTSTSPSVGAMMMTSCGTDSGCVLPGGSVRRPGANCSRSMRTRSFSNRKMRTGGPLGACTFRPEPPDGAFIRIGERPGDALW